MGIIIISVPFAVFSIFHLYICWCVGALQDQARIRTLLSPKDRSFVLRMSGKGLFLNNRATMHFLYRTPIPAAIPLQN
jgi:hypothetical protein